MVVSTVVLTGVAGSRIHTLSQSNKATDLGGGEFGGFGEKLGKIETMSVGRWGEQNTAQYSNGLENTILKRVPRILGSNLCKICRITLFVVH